MFYIYNVPGRARIISDAIKKNPLAADKVRMCLSTLTGIGVVHINLTTGSILIHYNPKSVKVGDTVDVLQRKGYYDRTKAISNDEYFRRGLSRVETTATKTVIETFIGKAVGDTFFSFLMVLF
ncbi:MAG: HMA2 domain-containing protein [Dissulfurispiraceae bacterium]